MQEDAVARAIQCLGLEERTDATAAEEVDTRAVAMMHVAVRAILVRAGRRAMIQIFDEAIDAATGGGEPPINRHDPAAFTAAMLEVLRRRDPLDAEQATQAHEDAGAMIVAGAAFLQERHGGSHMAAYVAGLVQALHAAQVAGDEPVAPQADPAPVLPPPPGMENLTPQPRKDLTVAQRVGVMSAFLRASRPEEARDDTLASFTAGAQFLRERFGEAFAVRALRDVERSVSAAAALDRWQPAGAARH